MCGVQICLFVLLKNLELLDTTLASSEEGAPGGAETQLFGFREGEVWEIPAGVCGQPFVLD